MKFEVLTVVNINITVIWVVTPQSLVDRYKFFGAACCLHLQGRRATWNYMGSDNDIALHIDYFSYAILLGILNVFL
jgi:hypothetical protein